MQLLWYVGVMQNKWVSGKYSLKFFFDYILSFIYNKSPKDPVNFLSKKEESKPPISSKSSWV